MPDRVAPSVPAAALPGPRLLYAPGDPAASGDEAWPAPARIPAWAIDLRLDELAAALGPGDAGERRLRLLLAPLAGADGVAFRQEVFRDLEAPAIGDAFRAFGEGLAAVRATLGRSARMRHPAERDRWVLDALERHDAALLALASSLGALPVRSRGLAAVRDHVGAVTASAAFARRRADTAEARAGLDGVAYRLRIGLGRVVVGPARDEPDLATEIRATFARLREGDPTPLRVDRFDGLDMNPLEAEVLARVVRLAPEPFARLAAVVSAQQPVVEPTMAAVEADAAWYLAVLDLLAPLRRAGLRCGYPSLAADGALEAEGLFDLALARRLLAEGRGVATSDLTLAPAERLVVVTGPGKGGRTSFARAVGQLHVLAAAGCPVPAARASVPLAARVATVFDRPERLDDPGGRLRTELRGVRALLDAAAPATLVVANEPFASTTAADALELTRRLLASLAERGARAIAVTFLEELAEDPGVVSVAAVQAPADPAMRTFRFARRPADGLAHAQLLATRHGLDAEAIRSRVAP